VAALSPRSSDPYSGCVGHCSEARLCLNSTKDRLGSNRIRGKSKSTPNGFDQCLWFLNGEQHRRLVALVDDWLG
jgi:hypothetical protein